MSIKNRKSFIRRIIFRIINIILVAGLGIVTVTGLELGFIAIVYIIIFSLEGLGIFSSKVVLQQG